MWGALTDTLVSLGLQIISIFPASPFQPLINSLKGSAVAEVLGYVNWFIPIGTMLGILAGWLACIAAYYVYQIILRWIKVIE